MARKEEIARVFMKLYELHGREPTMAELREKGVSRKTIRYNYNSKTQMAQELIGDKSPETEATVEVVKARVDEVMDAKKDFTEERKAFIVDSYLEVIEKTKRFPVYADFIPYGITAGVISSLFGGISKLQEFVVQNYEDRINSNFTTLGAIRNSTKVKSDNYIGKRYIITTAVADFKAHPGFMAAIENYSKRNDAEIFILPCESTTNSFENNSAVFDRAFANYAGSFVTEDIELNDNLFLCSIQVSAKQIKATTGLTRLGKRGGSYIFASPKQFLDYRPSGNDRGKNYSIMTTGSCTTGDYFTNNSFVSKRLSYIADHDHMLGAIIVEIEDDKHFHFRQIQADVDGNFIDLGVMYTADGDAVDVPMNLVLGDLHGVNVNHGAVNAFLEDFKGFDIDNVFLHDVFDGVSVSHHIGTIYEKQKRVNGSNNDLKVELKKTFDIIKEIANSFTPNGKTYIVKSNHDEFLTRYLKEGRYVNDPQNHYLALKIAVDMFDGMDVLESGFLYANDFDSDISMFIVENLEFLDRDSSVKIGGVEVGIHGDLGINGAKPSLNGLEEVYGNCIIGHNHSAAIQRGVFRVGTMSSLNLEYNRGPSSWTHTNCIIYPNGQRQLVNLVNGKYYLK